MNPPPNIFLEREASERSNAYVVRSWLKRFPNEAVKCNASVCEEKIQQFSFRYVSSVKFPHRRVVGSNHKMSSAFRAHFRDRFTHCANLPVQKTFISI